MKPASAITPEWRLKMLYLEMARNRKLEKQVKSLLEAAEPQKLGVYESSSAAISMFPSEEID